MLIQAETKSAESLAEVALQIFNAIYPRSPNRLVKKLFNDIDGMFAGRYLDYQPIDVGYHDFEHTLKATLCFLRLVEGRYGAGVNPPLSSREFEMGLAAVLLHDTGYLKVKSDWSGTGAKYTNCHVARSCAFATIYLPSLNFNSNEIASILSIIRCTEHHEKIANIQFSCAMDKHLGCLVATADYIGQMAAADYLDELPTLFLEFQEADDFMNVPEANRIFHSGRDLVDKTAAFWEVLVLPKLINDFQGVYRYLADPYPSGPNSYVHDIERNVALTQHARCAVA